LDDWLSDDDFAVCDPCDFKLSAAFGSSGSGDFTGVLFWVGL